MGAMRRRDDDMKASKQRVALPAHPRNFTADQATIMFDDIERRHRNFMAMWRSCADRRCRRNQQCLGCPKFPCTGGRPMGRRSKRQNYRILREFFSAPPAALWDKAG